MRVLVLITDRANPPLTATRVRNFYLWPDLKRLGVEVRVLGIDLEPGARFSPGPPQVESEFVRHEREEPLPRFVRSLLYSYHQWPYSERLANRIDRVVAEWSPTIIHAEELRMAPYLPRLRGIEAPAKQTVAIHNVESDLLRQTGSTAYPYIKPLVERMHLLNLTQLERKVFENCDMVFAYSAVDKRRYEELYETVCTTTSGGADVRHRVPAPEVNDASLLLVGSWNYQPNIAGLEWFIREVRPQISPAARVTVAGSGASTELQRTIKNANFTFIDRPLELEPLYKSHAIAVVPLLTGSGTRGRILEALSYGRVVVTTKKGIEGLDLAKGEGVLLADEPKLFAKKINLLLENPKERALVGHAGYRAVLQKYDWRVVAENLVAHWKKLTSGYIIPPQKR